MRNAKLKFTGLIIAIIGFLILAGLGWWYVWADRSVPYIDKSPFMTPAIIGAILLAVGLLAYIFIDE